ncbi:MAG TPA: right-handed parallel beta-helix repeat-containing protein [Thermoanaerobaculia bacterium]|nr:right-handed parallel beta-helix repeat-containing protein [Thermoanaerobaculia bacterium]
MRGNAYVLLALGFTCLALPAGAAPSARKAELLARAASLKATPAPARPPQSSVVDCTKGDSLQAAIDKSQDDDVIEVRGLCNENVQIQRKRLTLHGLDPATDGIRGVAPDPPAVAALHVWYANGGLVENLSFTDTSPGGVGLALGYSFFEARNCRMVGNPANGVRVSLSSVFFGTEVTLADSGGAGLLVQRSSEAFCTGCRLENNAGFAADARFGSLLTLLDGVVTGSRGLRAVNQSYADIDCVTEDTAYPCSLNVTRTAGLAIGESTVSPYGAGPFAGQLVAFDHGEIYVYGAQQTSTGVGPSGNPLPNTFEHFSTLVVEQAFETGEQSQLKGHTQVSGFSRALLRDATTVNGTLACDSAGDAWKDPGVIVTGGPVTGCEHVP